MLPKHRTRSSLSLALAFVLFLLSALPIHAQSDNAADGVGAARTVFLPLVATGGPQDAIDAEVVDVVEVSDATPNRSQQALSAAAPLSLPDVESIDIEEVSAASKDVVCLVSNFSLTISPYSYRSIGAYSTTQCKYIDVKLNSNSNIVWVRVWYYKGNSIKYGKWFYITTTSLYRILKNPKAGSVFYLEFYNPFSFTSYEQGVLYR